MIQTRCEKCGKRYRVDENKIPGYRAKFQCSVCQNTVYIIKPPPKFPPPEKTVPWNESTVILKRESYFDSGEWQRMKISLPKEEKPLGLRFTTKLMMLMLVLTLIPWILFSGFYLKQTQDSVKTAAGQVLAQAASDLVYRLDEGITQNIQVLQTAAQIPDMVSMAPKRQEAVLKAIQQGFPEMGLFCTSDLNGLNITRTDGHALENIADQSYFKEILNGKEPVLQMVRDKQSKEPLLVLAVPIKANGKPIGLLIETVNMQKIFQGIKLWRQGRTGRAFLVDENDKVLAHPNKDYDLQQKDLGRHPLLAALKSGRPGSLYFRNEVGTHTLGVAQATRYGWVLMTQQDADEVEQTFGRGYQTYFIFGAVLLYMVLGTWLSSIFITRPLTKLIRSANRMSLGDLNVEIPEHTQGEIGQLSRSLQRLQASLKLSIRALEHWEPPL